MKRRILALQLKRIGDLLLTTPALAALRKHEPDAQILLCGGPVAEALRPALPMVDGVLPWRDGLQSARCLGGIAVRSFAECYDFTGTDRSALLTAMSGAGKRGCFAWIERKGWRARVYNQLVESSVRERHTVDHYLDLVGLAQPDVTTPHAVLEIPAETQDRAAEVVRAANVPGEYGLVHPGSARAEKHWPAARWAELLHRVADVFPGTLVVTGSDAAEEREHLDEILTLCEPLRASNKLVDLAGKTPILTLAAVISQARFLIGVDSAAIHFAGGFGVPSVALYGPTNPYHWRVRQPGAWVVQAGYPGATPPEAFTPKIASRPMDDLAQETVWDGVRRVL